MAVETSTARDRRAPSRYLPAEAVLALDGLQLRARCVADGLLSGLHRSRRHGESAEFAEHKLYAPGDDLGRLDWKALAKSDRYFIKRFEEETSLAAYLVVDRSGSMAYPSDRAHNKYDYAATLAASLAYVLLAQGDAVGLLDFVDDSHLRLPPSARRSQVHEICAALENHSPGGRTAARQALAHLGDLLRRRALVFVFTDLLGVANDEGGLSAVIEGLARLRARGADVSLVQVLHPHELELPFHGVVRFDDLEGGEPVQVDADAIREAYREEVQSFVAEVERRAHGAGLSYQLARCDHAPAQVLATLLARRHSGRWS